MDSWNVCVYSNDSVYNSDFTKIAQGVKKSDVLITDGTHRIVGLMYNEQLADSPIITVQCIRPEVAYAKQIAFCNNIKIYTAKYLSADLFSKYMVGTKIREPEMMSVAKIYRKLSLLRR